MLAPLFLATIATTQPAPRAELVGFAVLPADTFRDGPTSGQFIDPANDRTPPFVDKQPVQGISSMIATDVPGTYLAVSDNGFGAKRNSADYVLCVYEVTPNFETGEVTWKLAFELSDPDDILDWPIVAEMETYPDSDIPVPAKIKEGRKLTGADFDIESMVRLPDGTFWIGDEFGPFLLHFSADGKLLEPPVELPGESMHSPDHPTKDPATAKIARSAGFEGLGATIADLPTQDESLYVALWPTLEKPLDGESGLRTYIYRANFPTKPEKEGWGEYKDKFPYGLIQLSEGAVALGETSASSANIPYYVHIERDNKQGAEAHTKLISASFENVFLDSRNRLQTTPVADLLDLADPNDLDGDGSTDFRFPFVTIESVVVVDERTVLICNDNNYPFSNGRSETEPDHTEFILVHLPKPLSEMGRN